MSQDNSVHVFENGAQFGRAAAELLLQIANQAIADRGVFSLALSGGSMASQLSARLKEEVSHNSLEVFVCHRSSS